MTRERLNFIIRSVLALVGALSLFLFILAARPTPYYQSVILGVADTTQPILNDWNVPAAYVTISHPAVIGFPSDWKIADHLCMAVRYQRGTAPTALAFDDALPQSRWDERPEEALVITTNEITMLIHDGSTTRFADSAFFSAIETRAAFRVNWFDNQPILLYKDQAVDKLLCYAFQSADGITRVPFIHLIRFTALNAHVIHAPAFYFRYNADPDPQQPSQAITLQKVDIGHYLTGLLIDGVPVVKPLTAEQKGQRATETAVQR